MLNKDEKIELLVYGAEHAPEGILSVNKDGRIVYANKKANDILKYSKYELVGKYVSDIDPNFSKDNWGNHWKKIKTEESVKIESEHMRKDGTKIPVELSINYIKYKGQERHITFIRNISNQKEKERQLKRSRDEYQELINGMRDAVFVVDMKGYFLTVNDAAVQRMGYTKEEFFNMSPKDIDAPKYSKKVEERMKKIEEQEYLVFESVHVTKYGEKIPVEISSTTISFKNENAILSVARDITERKKHKKEKEEIQQNMFQIQKLESIGQLAGGIAHDFNNILTVIQGHAQMAMQGLDKSTNLFSHLNQIKNSSSKAAKLTKQLLLFSRKKETEFNPINLNSIIKSMEKMLKRLIGEDIDIELDLYDELWTIYADDSQMEQVLTNLCINARDAMSKGGQLTISTSNKELEKKSNAELTELEAGEYVCLKVKDTGEGIDKKIRDNIFDPFFTTKEKGEGTGMGLSVVHGIVKKHGGRIEVDSEIDKGTEFRIFFPADRKIETEKSDQKTTISKFEGSGEKILVVEDDPDVLHFLCRVLDKNNYNTFGVNGIDDALDIFGNKKDEIEILISDIIMPDMRGDKFASKLKQKKAELKVILASGYTDRKVNEVGLDEGEYTFIRKPFKVLKLLKTVKETLNNRLE